MSRILICVGAFEPSLIFGGQAVVAADHAFALAQRGHEVTVLTTNLMSLRPARRHDVATREERGVRIHHLPAYVLYPHLAAVIVPGLHDWLQRRLADFDVVHIHFTREFLPIACAAAAFAAGRPYLLQTHGNLFYTKLHHRIVDWLFVRKALRNAAVALTLQEPEERNLRQIEPSVRVERLPNGIQLPAHVPPWNQSRLEPVPRVLFVGRLDREKGVLDLIEALGLLARRGLRLCCEIVGPDAGQLAAARARAAQLGIGEAVEFVGALTRERTLETFARSSLYVSASTRESFSMTLVEALSFGVPAVITTGNQIASAVAAAGAALVVEPGAANIAAAIEAVVRDPVRAQMLSRQGFEWVRSNCSMDAVVTRLEAIYAAVAATSP